MKFPASFTRWVGTAPAGGKALGTADATLPTGRASAELDNCLFAKFSNINGWPVQRIAVTYAGPALAPTVTARMWFYEDSTGQWYKVGADVMMAPSTVSFFDVIAILEMSNTLAQLDQATSGSVAQFLQVDLPGGSPADGAYVFAMAPDLTSQA
jgi:hypothetical protein